MSSLEPELLEILACPKCDSRPPLRDDDGWLVCTACGYAFPIVNGIPHLLVESAVAPDELEEARRNPRG